MHAAPTTTNGRGLACDAPVRVVIADDNAATRTLVRHVLSRGVGITLVGEASDGYQAVSLVDSYEPDCVVLDVQMPGVDGFEALADLRRRHPVVPVIMLSGFLDVALTTRAMASGAAAILDKTTQLTQLRQTIHLVTNAATSNGVGSAPTRAVPVLDDMVGPDDPFDATEASAATASADLRTFEFAVSHDFSEPLRSMRGFATLLSDQYSATLEGSGLLFLHHIISAADRMQTMIDELLVYSRAGQKPARADVVDVRGVVVAVLDGLRDVIAERHAIVDIADVPLVVGDAEMITTVLRHLLVNALTFNTAPEPTVRIRGSVDGRLAAITVADNGIGIGPTQHHAVFDLFRRLNTVDEYPGNGTGLALCRRLLAAQAGSLEIASSTRDGTVFRLLLPRPYVTPGVAR